MNSHESITGAKTRDRTYAIYKILINARDTISPTRCGMHAGVNNRTAQKYVQSLRRHGFLKDVPIPKPFREWRHSLVQITPKGEEVIKLIRDLYQLFDIDLDR